MERIANIKVVGKIKKRRWRNWHELSIERFKFFHTFNCPPQISHAFFSMHVAKGVRSLSFPLYMSFSCYFCFFRFYLNAEKSLCCFFKLYFRSDWLFDSVTVCCLMHHYLHCFSPARCIWNCAAYHIKYNAIMWMYAHVCEPDEIVSRCAVSIFL